MQAAIHFTAIAIFYIAQGPREFKSYSQERNMIEGVIAAVPTPFDPLGGPDLPNFIRHCKWALENGADGLNVLGTTGEANSLPIFSRKQIMKAAAEALDPGKLMVGTATPDFETTLDLTRYAHELGYPVALILPPYYYKPVSDSGLLGWFNLLDQGLDDAKIELYLYNFPALTGIEFSIELIKALSRKLPNRVTGIKDSSANIPYCKEIVEKIPEFKVFPSSETGLGTARDDGFAGCISASVNVTAPLAAKLWHQSKGTPISDIQETVTALRTAAASVPLIPAIKYLISLREEEPEWEAVRLPLEPLSNSEKEALQEAAAILGY
jgi:4-hydroxy-tetrahydrodipicolinate synthase